MSVPVGLSVSDCVGALKLVATVRDALCDSGAACKGQYRDLLCQLDSLEVALHALDQLRVTNNQHDELVALKAVTAQCNATINHFWEKIRSYDPFLGPRAPERSSLRDKWMKVKWKLIAKDDIVELRARLQGQTGSIYLLMSAIQSKNQGKERRSLVGRIQDSCFLCLEKLSTVSDSIASSLEQSKQLLALMTEVVIVNIRVFQIFCAFMTRIPSQVEGQQPVYMIDGLGRSCSIPLDFIRCKEALISVLAINFSKVGAEARIEQGQFVIEDSLTKQDIDLDVDWDLCFFPGQHVEMSMIFQQKHKSESECPQCHTNSEMGIEANPTSHWVPPLTQPPGYRRPRSSSTYSDNETKW